MRVHAASTAAASVKSSGSTIARPAASASPATDDNFSAERADSATRAPSVSISFAVSAPMPVDAPTIQMRASGHAGSGGFSGANTLAQRSNV